MVKHFLITNDIISTIIKIENVFVGSLVRHSCLSRSLSSFTFGNTYPYFIQFLSLFAFRNTERVL